jgi:hypothetical protein
MEWGRDEIEVKLRQVKPHFHQDLIGCNGGGRCPEVLPAMKATHAGYI